jgi:hypothetical protein
VTPFQLNGDVNMFLTASLTAGVARVTHEMLASTRLVDEILTTDHAGWETTLPVGDVEFHRTKDGPFPNHQLRSRVGQRRSQIRQMTHL